MNGSKFGELETNSTDYFESRISSTPNTHVILSEDLYCCAAGCPKGFMACAANLKWKNIYYRSVRIRKSFDKSLIN